MSWVERLFAGCAILGGLLFVIRLILFFIGGDAEAEADVDVEVEFEGVDAADLEGLESTDVSFRLLSFQGVTAFFMMFGLVGLALRRESKAAEGWSVLGATAAGVVALFVIAKIFSFMRGLQSSGTLDIRNAVGQEGSVYLTIPVDGIGKVQVTVQERLKVLNARTEGSEEIKTGERVMIVKVVGDNILVVDKLQSA